MVHPSDKLTEDEKIALVRDLVAEYATSKGTIPRSRKPLIFNSDGTWDRDQWAKAEISSGIAARLGDKVQITKIALDGDHMIIEINGGLKTGGHWYDHVQVGVGMTTQPINGDSTARYGTTFDLQFHKPMENLTAADVKKILSPLFDFDKHSATELYAETLPPAVKKAISDKRVIEGMDRDQVVLALGHPEHKYRETKDGVDTEDWIYGTPPGKITFVTFAGSKVIKVKEEYAGLGIETSPDRIATP